MMRKFVQTIRITKMMTVMIIDFVFRARYGVLFVPPSKAPKLGSWQWKEADAVENVVKHPFSGQPGIK